MISRTTSEPAEALPPPPKYCQLCPLPHKARGRCIKHYQQAIRENRLHELPQFARGRPRETEQRRDQRPRYWCPECPTPVDKPGARCPAHQPGVSTGPAPVEGDDTEPARSKPSMTYSICTFETLAASMIQHLSYDKGYCLVIRKPWKNVMALIDVVTGFGDERSGDVAFADCCFLHSESKDVIEELGNHLAPLMPGSPIYLFIDGKFVKPE